MSKMRKLTTKVDMDGKRASVYCNGKLICDIYSDRETGMEFVYVYATENDMRIGISGEKEVRYTFTNTKEIKPTKF